MIQLVSQAALVYLVGSWILDTSGTKDWFAGVKVEECEGGTGIKVARCTKSLSQNKGGGEEQEDSVYFEAEDGVESGTGM